jgi:HAD superfamily hydrolase (TIGR01484 family)
MRRKVIAFDLDGTLAPSKTALPDSIADLLDRLLEQYHVCIISGGKYEIYQQNVLSNLKADPSRLERLHLMPTCGTSYYKYDAAKHDWEKVYSEDLTSAEKDKVRIVMADIVKKLGYEEKETYGEILEDRGSMMAWSALGQEIIAELGEEGLRRKEEWDPDNSKKAKIRDAAAELLPNLEVRAGGLTTIDITKPGIDKAYGMKKLMEMLEIGKEEVFFIGDRVYEGGNDYPVKMFGIDTIQIDDWKQTAVAIEAIIQVS